MISTGVQAVDAFFVLSGFVIAHVSAVKERDARTYFISRAARIYSVAIPAIILTSILDAIGSLPRARDGMRILRRSSSCRIQENCPLRQGVHHDQQTLPMQLSAMRAYAKRNGWRVILKIEEVGSGATTRPQREELLRAARRKEIDVIVVWRLDRWGRSLVDLVTT